MEPKVIKRARLQRKNNCVARDTQRATTKIVSLNKKNIKNKIKEAARQNTHQFFSLPSPRKGKAARIALTSYELSNGFLTS